MKKRRNAVLYRVYSKGRVDGSDSRDVGGRKEMKYKLRYLSLFLIRSTALFASPRIRTLGGRRTRQRPNGQILAGALAFA
jgi:hypothetical protein